VVFNLARYGQRELQFPSCDSMTHGNGRPRALFSRGAAFELKRRRRHAAITSHRIRSAARRARANPEARGRGPAAAMADLLPAADNSHICSGESLVSELRAVPLPSSGHTHLAVRLTVGDAASSPVSGLKLASPAGMSTWKSACLPENESRLPENNITSRTLRENIPLNLQFAEYFA
jgi:hypothetical protein